VGHTEGCGALLGYPKKDQERRGGMGKIKGRKKDAYILIDPKHSTPIIIFWCKIDRKGTQREKG